MMLIAGIIACAIGMFYAGYQRGVRVRAKRCNHHWSDWSARDLRITADGVLTSCNARFCYRCKVTQATPIV